MNKSTIHVGYFEGIKGAMRAWRDGPIRYFNYRCKITGQRQLLFIMCMILWNC
jgi:hypothetical protein